MISRRAVSCARQNSIATTARKPANLQNLHESHPNSDVSDSSLRGFYVRAQATECIFARLTGTGNIFLSLAKIIGRAQHERRACNTAKHPRSKTNGCDSL